MPNISWYIEQVEHHAPDGLVKTAHWRVYAADDKSSAANYGTVYFNRGDAFTPYLELTETQVLDWVKAKLDVAAIESALLARLNAAKTPVKKMGVPWNQGTASYIPKILK